MIKTDITIEELNKRNKGNMSAYLGMEFTGISSEYLKAKMPVNSRTTQPLGVIHGGANAALAESLGSMAAYLSLDRSKYICLGMDLKCSHLRSATHGCVYGIATNLHAGKKTHVWEVKIVNEEGELSCFSTVTLAVLPLTEELKKKHRDILIP